MDSPEVVYEQVNACFQSKHFDNNGWRLCNRPDVHTFGKLEDNRVGRGLIDYKHILTHHGLLLTKKEKPSIPLLYELIWQFKICKIYDVTTSCRQKAVLLTLEKCCPRTDCIVYMVVNINHIAYSKAYDPWVEKVKIETQATEIHIGLHTLREIPELWQAVTVLPRSNVYIEKAKDITPEESKQLYHMKRIHFDGTQESTISKHISSNGDLESIGICDMQITSMESVATKLQQHDRLQSLIINNVIMASVKPVTRLKQLSNLHLESMKISNLSELCFALENLESLSMIACQLRSLPENAFDKLEKLKILNLSRNCLTVLPPNVCSLSKLEILILEDNCLKSVERIVSLKGLRELNLNSNVLTELPKEISDLQNLETLSLNNNALQEIPQTMRRMQCLEALYLDFNRLSSFASEMTLPNNVKKLSLKGNSIKEIPSFIGNMRVLEVADFSQNRISIFSEELCSCTSLKKMEMNDNMIENLPETIEDLSHLEMLSLDRNKLSAFPKVLGKLPSLKILWMEGNFLKEIPSCIKEMKTLENLGLNKNDISLLSQEISLCHTLKQIWIEDNAIDNLPNSMEDLTNLEILSMKRNKLSVFPNVVMKLSSLKTLQMEGNRIKEIPSSIKELTSLEKINLMDTGISAIPKDISHCQKLKRLWIDDNAIEDLPDSMADLTSLESLSVQRNKLSVFPNVVMKLSSLKTLQMEGNKIKEIPSSIKEMKSLEILDLMDTGISAIPKDISHCQKLKGLWIDDNAIEDLPDSMTDLTDIETLSVKRNKLSVFPNVVMKLSSLKILHMEGNKIKEIPSSIKEMTSLEEIDLADTGISALPEDISYCQKLKKLWIADNAIEDLPDSMEDLTNLEILSVKRNKLSVFPNVVMKLSSLKTLDIGGNKIKEIPPGIKEMKSLEILDLTETGISTLLEDISHCEKLKRLVIDDNAIEALPDSMADLTNLEILSVKQNKQTVFPNVVMKLSSLKILYMKGNQIKEIPPGIKALTSLEDLDLAETGISVMPEEISHCRKLKSLDISLNDIQELPTTMKDLTLLEELWLDGNKLSSFPKVVFKMPKLNTLHLGRNNIKTIPPGVKDMQSLKKLVVNETGISVLPNEIGFLTALEQIWIMNNKIRSLPLSLKLLTKLQGLYAGGNDIQELPTTMKDLTLLEELWFDRNKLSSFPKVAFKMPKLNTLHLGRNKIKTIPPGIKVMQSLKELDVCNTGLSVFPNEIGFLTSLEKIWIRNNDIRSLPLSLKLLTKLQRIYASGNDITVIPDIFEDMNHIETLEVDLNSVEYPPPAICKEGVKAIAQFYTDYRGDTISKNSRTKINLIGETMVGKTSLALSLSMNIPGYVELETKRTQVLQTMLWKPANNIEFQINDFGGHHLYKITHHIFQTEKSTNLILYDLPRYKDTVFQQCIGFWLDRLLASCPGMSNVFFVGARTDEIKHEEDVARKEEEVKNKVNARKELFLQRTEQEIQDLKKKFDSQLLQERSFTRFAEAITHDVHEGDALQDLESIINFSEAIQHDISVRDSRIHTRMELHEQGHMYKRNTTEGTVPDFSDDKQGTQQWRQPSEELQRIFSRLKRLLQLQSEIKKMTFHFHALSCKTGQGLKEIHESLCHVGKLSSHQIPESWQDTIKTLQKYFKETQHVIVRIEELFRYTRGHSSHIIDKTSFEWRQFTDILNHLHYCGEMLWYRSTKDLQDVVFPNIQRLIDVLKAIFHHDLDKHLSSVKAFYPSARSFEHDVDSWRRCGKMTEVLLERLLKSKGLSNVPVDVIQQLLVRFNIWYVFEPEGSINKPSLLMPWFLKEKQPLEVGGKWEHSPSPCQYDLAITFTFSDNIPETFFERMVVLSAGTAAPHSTGVYIWKDGLFCKVNLVKIMLKAINRRRDCPGEDTTDFDKDEDFPIRICNEIQLQSKGRNILGIWDVVFPLFEKISMYIQDEWPGITYAAEMTCPHCIQHNITPCDVIPQEFIGSRCPGHVEVVQCREIDIPAVIARPVMSRMCTPGQREVLQQYEDEIQNRTYESGPLTQDIIVWLANKIGPNYGKLAAFLNVPYEREKKIEREHPRNVDRQIIEVLTYFRKDFMDKGKTNAECMQHLMKTLDVCDLKQFRQELERKLEQ